ASPHYWFGTRAIGVDKIGRTPAVKCGQQIVAGERCHAQARLGGGASYMRHQNYIVHFEQRRRNLGLVLKDVKASPSDAPALQSLNQCGLLHDVSAGSIDEKSRGLYQSQLRARIAYRVSAVSGTWTLKKSASQKSVSESTNSAANFFSMFSGTRWWAWYRIRIEKPHARRPTACPMRPNP